MMQKPWHPRRPDKRITIRRSSNFMTQAASAAQSANEFWAYVAFAAGVAEAFGGKVEWCGTGVTITSQRGYQWGLHQ